MNNKREQLGTYEMKNMTLKQVNQEKDIRVIVDGQLKFQSHTYEKINKSNSIMGLICKSSTKL